MKENWTYKKLGEVCEIYQPQTISTEMLVPDGEYRVYGANGIIGRYDKYNHAESEVLLTCRGATCGSINVSAPYSWINGNAMVIHPIDDSVFCSRSFLVYLMKSIDYSLVITGAAQPQITRQKLSPVKIAIPPIETQSRIVAELDLLQSIIDKQKAQLKELDNLAQAIFYDMFGDPVENEKGWEVKTMGEVGELQRGSGLSKKDLIEDGFPCMLYGQIHTRFGAYTKKHIACIPKELVKTAKIAHPGDVIMAITSEDVEGSCKSVAWMGDYDIAIGSDAAIYRHSMNGIYVSYYTQTKAFYNEKAKYAKGFKVTHISTKEIASISIPVPPLSLQQTFAAKIESIEKQKTSIGKSIEETQKLFNFTMDKYFG